MNDSEGAALLAAINENPADLAPRLIYSDWLEENGRASEALGWRGQMSKSQPLFDFYGDGFGDGYGGGSGGDEDGTGGDGAGSGDGWFFGFGDVEGFGWGEEYRDGYVSGEQYGYVSVKKQPTWINDHKIFTKGRPVIGKQMLIWCGRGFARIGHVEEMYAPGCYKLSNAGMLCRTGPDSWMAVASGAARDNYVYRHAPDGIVYTGPELHGAVEWKGELPGRDMR